MSEGLGRSFVGVVGEGGAAQSSGREQAHPRQDEETDSPVLAGGWVLPGVGTRES